MLREENKPLAPLTTLGVGGAARWFVEARREADVFEAAAWSKEIGIPLFVLGGGSNLLVSDAGFNGLVLRCAIKGIQVRDIAADPLARLYQVAAGEQWDAFVQRSVQDNCAGIECLAGIPGTVGGTPVQNVGAYGQEVASTIDRVRAFDLDKSTFAEFTASECGFGYRHSRFNAGCKGRYVVTRVDYHLYPGGAPALKYADLQRELSENSNPTLVEAAEAVRRIRQSKGMLLTVGDPDCLSAGSFFKNPFVHRGQVAHVGSVAGADPPCFAAGSDNPCMVKLPAAWLIEKAGFTKGYTLGRAAISRKHTLAIVNRGGASAAEIVALADQIRCAVASRFGIELQMEPVMLGF